MRIAVVTDPGQLNSAYRGFQPGAALQQCGHDVHMRIAPEEDLHVEMLRGFDAVYVYRYFEKPTQRLLKAIRETGAAVIWDNDDDMTYFPDDSIVSMRKGALHSQEALAKTKAMCRLADVVTTPSQVLASTYRSLGAPAVHVVENYVIDDFLHVERRPHDDVVIGWVACAEHAYDMEQLSVRETLRSVLNAFADLRVVSVGVDLKLVDARYHCHGFIPFHELPAAIAEFDIGIAPIVDDPGNRARSNVKVKEYSALGVPWLASPIGPYEGLGEQQGGRLVADDGWPGELTRLVRRGRARRKLAKRAARWGREQAIQHHAQRWSDALAEAVERRQRSVD